jgi:hypothetical protein
MKKSDVIVKVKLGEVLDAPLIGAWDELCSKYGINEWCLNEGRADSEDTIEVSYSDAKRWGLIENDD